VSLLNIKRLGVANIHDCGLRGPRHTKVLDPKTGRMTLSKLPWVRQEKWVNQAGHVTRVHLCTGSALPFDPEVAALARADMAEGGGIAYAQCPLVTGSLAEVYFPEELRDLCKPDTYSEQGACPHVEFVIVRRREDYREEEMLKRRVYESQRYQELQAREKAADGQAAQAAATTRAAEAMVEMMNEMRAERAERLGLPTPTPVTAAPDIPVEDEAEGDEGIEDDDSE
jgi:hypothetical protein